MHQSRRMCGCKGAAPPALTRGRRMRGLGPLPPPLPLTHRPHVRPVEPGRQACCLDGHTRACTTVRHPPPQQPLLLAHPPPPWRADVRCRVAAAQPCNGAPQLHPPPPAYPPLTPRSRQARLASAAPPVPGGHVQRQPAQPPLTGWGGGDARLHPVRLSAPFEPLHTPNPQPQSVPPTTPQLHTADTT